jgi:hypothetical protein
VELVEVAEAGPLGELGRAQAERLRAQIIFVRTDGRDGTVQLLLRAAQRLDPLDRDLARAAYVDAMRAAVVSGDPLEAGRRLRALPVPAAGCQRAAAARLWRVRHRGVPHGLDVLAQTIDAFVSAPVTGPDAGELAGAAAARDEAEAIRQATGMEPGFGGDSGLLAALREEERAATGHIEQLRREAGIGGVSGRAARLEHTLAVLYNGLARYPDALAAARRSHERHPGAGFGQALAELVEAAGRCRQPEVAQTALEALCAHARLGGMDWGLGVEAYSRARLAEGTAAEELYREAIGRLGRTRMRLPLARRPPALRGMAAPPAPPHRRPHPAAQGARPVRGDGRPVIRRPGPAGTDRDRRHRAQPPQRDPG